MKKIERPYYFAAFPWLFARYSTIQSHFFKEFGQAMLLPLADEPAQSRSAKQPIEAGLEMLRGLPLEA
jgi:hypothetical protein